MNFPTARKRKADGSLSESDIPTRAKLKRFHPPIHILRIPIMTDNEDEAFPSDRITSDPTFFDDFMPEEPQTLPQPLLTPSSAKQDTSPTSARHLKLGKGLARTPQGNRNLSDLQGDWLSDDEEVATFVQSEPDWQASWNTNTISQTAPADGDYLQSQEESDLRKSPIMDREELGTTAHEETSLKSGQGRQPPQHANTPPERSMMSDATVGTRSDHSPPVNEQLDDPREPDNAKEIRSRDSVSLSSNSASQQSESTSNDVSLHTPNVQHNASSESDPKSKHNIEDPSKSLPPRVTKPPSRRLYSSPAPTTKRKISKSNTSGRNGLQFEVLDLGPNLAYSVKHWKETKSEIGRHWSRTTKRTSFYTSITKYARIKYTVGDLVNLDFPEGEGGSAKILEVRDGDMTYIVVQWLYCRSDAGRLGARLPSLEKWPKGLYMLSDHFQVICAENVSGRSDSTPVEDVYWQISGKCLRPSDELVRRLQDQLG